MSDLDKHTAQSDWEFTDADTHVRDGKGWRHAGHVGVFVRKKRPGVLKRLWTWITGAGAAGEKGGGQ